MHAGCKLAMLDRGVRTRAPAAPSASAMALPMPRDDPVTTHTGPSTGAAHREHKRQPAVQTGGVPEYTNRNSAHERQAEPRLPTLVSASQEKLQLFYRQALQRASHRRALLQASLPAPPPSGRPRRWQRWQWPRRPR